MALLAAAPATAQVMSATQVNLAATSGPAPASVIIIEGPAPAGLDLDALGAIDLTRRDVIPAKETAPQTFGERQLTAMERSAALRAELELELDGGPSSARTRNHAAEEAAMQAGYVTID